MSYPNYPQPGAGFGQSQGYPPTGQPGYASYGNSTPYSPEDGGHGVDFDNAFSEKSIRQGFIRKVYSILSVQLLVSFGAVILFNSSKGAKQFAVNNGWMIILAFVISICTICPMICVQSLRRKTPHNYILLTLFTLAESVLLGFLGAFTKPDVVMQAVLITAGIVIGLTLFAFQTKWDFTMMNGIMVCVLLCFMLTGLIMSFFPSTSTGRIIYSSIGALIFSIYIVIDTQSIVGGNNRKYQISSEEYIFASLMLYLDIINLFTYILSILNESNN